MFNVFLDHVGIMFKFNVFLQQGNFGVLGVSAQWKLMTDIQKSLLKESKVTWKTPQMNMAVEHIFEFIMRTTKVCIFT